MPNARGGDLGAAQTPPPNVYILYVYITHIPTHSQTEKKGGPNHSAPVEKFLALYIASMQDKITVIMWPPANPAQCAFH